jgi:hypothetical protein
MDSTVRDAIFGAVVLPLTILGFLSIIGYGGRILPGGRRGNLLVLIWLGWHSMLGVGLALGPKNNVQVSPVVTVAALFLAAVTGLFAGSPEHWYLYEFAAAGTFISIIGLLLFGVEFVFRNHTRFRRAVAPVAFRRASLVGIVHALVLVSILELVLPSSSLFDLIILVWEILGSCLLAAFPVYLLLRSRLVLPIGLVTVISTYNAIVTISFQLSRQAGAGWSTPWTPLVTYLHGWFVLLPLVLLVAVAEYVLRDWLNLFPPRPVRVSRQYVNDNPATRNP